MSDVLKKLEEIFGDKSLSFADFKSKTKDIKFADLAGGEYVSKQKYTDELADAKKQADGFKEQIKTLTADLENHGKNAKTIEDLQKSLTEATEKSKTDLAAKDKEIANTKKMFSVKEHLRNAGAKDPELVIAALKLDFEKLNTNEKGEIVGLADLVAPLQKEKSYLFEVKQPNSTDVGGKKPPSDDNKTTLHDAIRERLAGK